MSDYTNSVIAKKVGGGTGEGFNIIRLAILTQLFGFESILKAP